MKRSPLRPVSKKRQKINAERDKNMIAHYGPKSSWRCSLIGNAKATELLGPCGGSVHPHEIVKRSQGGSITDPGNTVLLCNRHNESEEDHPGHALALGLMRHNWETEECCEPDYDVSRGGYFHPEGCTRHE